MCLESGGGERWQPVVGLVHCSLPLFFQLLVLSLDGFSDGHHGLGVPVRDVRLV